MKTNDYDCIVVGAGHAGAEAACAAARVGADTCLITISAKAIARMSCNPAIGGLGKGQIVREIDALGGIMAQAIDAAGIQFRILNRSKGPAVQAPRAQADKYKYEDYVRNRLEQIDNIAIVEAIVTQVITDSGAAIGVRCADGSEYRARTVILTTGTFLRGLMHLGTEQSQGGRIGEPAANELSQSLEEIGLKLGRLKTGTPPRLESATVDIDKLEAQYGDTDPKPFSFMTNRIETHQIPCWITYTNPKIHKLITDNLDRAPLYSGQITSTGPRYCPSIETKIVRFADKDRHQIFLEPEDAKNTTIYCNGISTSLPKEVQDEILHLLPGTENARIVHYGYAIEYDFCPPIQLKTSLETKAVPRLYLAGQINGTSGYEEAAAQGLIAGLNAARAIHSKDPIVLARDQAYIGVMIDDLLTKGVVGDSDQALGTLSEPYRMFTSRAEHRLTLRADNADRRLTELARSAGLIDDERWLAFQKKANDLQSLKEFLQSQRSEGSSLWDKLRRPRNTLLDELRRDPRIEKMQLARDVLEAAAIDAKYEGYLAKQHRLALGMQSLDTRKIPQDLDYTGISHLRAEAKEKLSTFRPETLGQASRINGITPADITVIQIHLKKSAQSTSNEKPVTRD